MEAYEAGQRDFGENKAQEMAVKAIELPTDIRWHMIGHLQTNKVKMIAPFVYMIHSVDSIKLLGEINARAAALDRIIPCLLQARIASEDTKYGMKFETITEAAAAGLKMKNISIDGLMGMATLTDETVQVRKEFKSLKMMFGKIKELYFRGSSSFSELSMGMSGDYKTAVEEGATMVRIGTAVFGGVS